MTPAEVAALFDARAATYHQNDWHRRSAERLVHLCAIDPPCDVLDAGAGTGFAAFAAARRGARVTAIDVSEGMLAQARATTPAELASRIVFQRADAADLGAFDEASFDWVLCATALHLMPAARALAQWRRVLRPGGRVAFSTVAVGTPRAGAVFREIAAEFGVALDDPSATLGTAAASTALLRAAGFADVQVVDEWIDFSPLDRSVAWASNLRSGGHAAVLALGDEKLESMRRRFERVLDEKADAEPESFSRVRVLYVMAR